MTQEVRSRILCSREFRDELESRNQFEMELSSAKRSHYESIDKQLREMKSIFYEEMRLRMPPELTVGQLEQTFGVYPSTVSSTPIDSLQGRLEKESLYVLSHLVL